MWKKHAFICKVEHYLATTSWTGGLCYSPPLQPKTKDLNTLFCRNKNNESTSLTRRFSLGSSFLLHILYSGNEPSLCHKRGHGNRNAKNHFMGNRSSRRSSYFNAVYSENRKMERIKRFIKKEKVYSIEGSTFLFV